MGKERKKGTVMEMVSPRRSWVYLCVLAGIGTGCASGPRAYQIQVAVDREGFSSPLPAMVVDLVPASRNDVERLTNISVNEYFTPGTPGDDFRTYRQQRHGLKTWTLLFSEKSPGPHALRRDDPLWPANLAGGAEYLFVLSFLPGAWEDKPGEQDPRRLILPLERKVWENDTIHLKVLKSGVQLISLRRLERDR